MSNLADIDEFIVKCVIIEKTNDEIAQMANFSPDLVKKRLGELFKRYRVRSKVGLVREIMKKTYLKAIRELDITSYPLVNPK